MRNENEKHVEIVCVIDRSGSMNAIAEDAIGAFNQFLKEQKEMPDPARLTLALFNHEYELVHDGLPLADVPDLDAKTYGISGTTALLDAVGITIDNVRNRLATLDEKDRPDGVLVAILTDGLENSSREYTRRQVFDLIKAQSAEGWEFMFLAANQDAIREGGRMGVAAKDASPYAHTAEGIRKAWHGVSGRASESRRRARERRESGSDPHDGPQIGFKP